MIDAAAIRLASFGASFGMSTGSGIRPAAVEPQTNPLAASTSVAAMTHRCGRLVDTWIISIESGDRETEKADADAHPKYSRKPVLPAPT
jgi:hypothetical protein